MSIYYFNNQKKTNIIKKKIIPKTSGKNKHPRLRKDKPGRPSCALSQRHPPAPSAKDFHLSRAAKQQECWQRPDESVTELPPTPRSQLRHRALCRLCKQFTVLGRPQLQRFGAGGAGGGPGGKRAGIEGVEGSALTFPHLRFPQS